MVPEFELVEIVDVPLRMELAYGPNADMVQTFLELDGQAMKIATTETTVKKIPQYTMLQNAAQRRGFGVRSRIHQGYLYIWIVGKEGKE